ncbi:MAG: hypothetical protein C4326_09010 [Ignavibacteria bacterium]
MITQLNIAGFKSFGIPGQRIELGALNFVVGANASGKSNLISALRFLQLAVRVSTEFATNEFGGITEVRNRILRERKSPKPMSIGFTMSIRNAAMQHGRKGRRFTIGSYSYELSLDMRSDKGVPEVISEILQADVRDQKGNLIPYRIERRKNEVVLTDQSQSGQAEKQTLKIPSQEATRLVLGVAMFSLPAVLLREQILHWRFYNISAEWARLPFKETPDADIGRHGENLGVVLHKIEHENGKTTIESLVSGLMGAVPGLKGIKPVQLPIEGKRTFQVVEEKIKGAIGPDSISDGTIRLLTLLVFALRKGNEDALLAVEEPENGLHPHLAEHVISILRTASATKQILATTHNSAFLDHLQPEEVHLRDKLDGFTKVRRASDIEEVQTFRKHFRLGEI